MASTAFRNFAGQFNRLINRIDRVDVRVPEDSALISLAADLVPGVTLLLREAIDLLSQVEGFYSPDQMESLSPSDDDESLSGIGFQISTEFAARDLGDLAFFARTDLRSSLEKLMFAATQRGDQLALASHCESGLRRVRKALVSVESAVYEFEGFKPPKRSWFDVEVSLQIRKLYWNLRRETGGHTVDQQKPLEERLRSVLYRIVAFRELSVYPLLRVEDRVTLRRLLKRILDWLNSADQPQPSGERLWQDLAAFAELLVQVSHRQELQDHDLELISRAYRALFPYGQPIPNIPEELRAELQSLLGLDTELDQLIAGSDSDPVTWKPTLQRLRQQLGRSRAMAGKIDLLEGELDDL